MTSVGSWARVVAPIFSIALVTSCGFLPFTATSTLGAGPLLSAPRPEPVDSAFDGCGPAGSQPDYALNRLKNRVDDGAYVSVAWSVIAKLPWPRRVGLRFRNQWTEHERAAVDRYEGAAVRIEGHVANYRLEVPEPPNCYSSRHKDYHVWLTENAHEPVARAIVVELTPRVRVRHAGWTDERLSALVATQVPVRVSGWLMLDQMHPENVKRNRRTLWEVHPVMQLEWKQPDGRWVSLDSLAPRERPAAASITRTTDHTRK